MRVSENVKIALPCRRANLSCRIIRVAVDAGTRRNQYRLMRRTQGSRMKRSMYHQTILASQRAKSLIFYFYGRHEAVSGFAMNSVDCMFARASPDGPMRDSMSLKETRSRITEALGRDSATVDSLCTETLGRAPGFEICRIDWGRQYCTILNMRWFPIAALALLISACSSEPATQTASSRRAWSKLETLTQITDKRVNESSGICASRSADGIYYTHNDSGDTARFFKFNRKGEILGVYNVANVNPAVDWEDIASATLSGKPYIFCGDIGDNAGVRKQIFVYRVPEPAPQAQPPLSLLPGQGDDNHQGSGRSNGRGGDPDPHPPTPSPISRAPGLARLPGGSREETGEGEKVLADRSYTLTYPDEPHNAETLMVNPQTSDIYIVTKAATKPSIVFKLAHPGHSGAYVLEKVGELSVGTARMSKLITAGDISQDAKHVVIRSYIEAWEYDAPAKWDDWFKQKPRHIQTNFEFQGEGICYSRDGKSLLTTSEGTPCPVSEGRLRG